MSGEDSERQAAYKVRLLRGGSARVEKLGITTEYAQGNSLSAEDYRALRKRLGNLSKGNGGDKNQNKRRVLLTYMFPTKPAYFGKGAHFVFLANDGNVVHEGPVTTREVKGGGDKLDDLVDALKMDESEQ